jgi:hypothetical protein
VRGVVGVAVAVGLILTLVAGTGAAVECSVGIVSGRGGSDVVVFRWDEGFESRLPLKTSAMPRDEG